MPPRFRPNIQWTLLKKQAQAFSENVYGALTLYGMAFQPISTYQRRIVDLILLHHIFHTLLCGIQFVLCRFRSLLLAASHIAFFSSAY
jgi:hypothetical protein